MRWIPEPEQVAHFTGRAEELARLDRWAIDPQVCLVGVTAWGGAGKTALVTQWALERGRLSGRPGVRGVFGWSFYAEPSAEHWAAALLEWAQQDLGITVPATDRKTMAVLRLLREVPLLLVLDGLEVVQKGPAGDAFGRLLDGSLREVLSGVCQRRHGGLVLLTSRFPFADLETFDGGSARMMDVPPFTPAEGSALLAALGGEWLADSERRALVWAVDGHALAVGVLAGLLAAHPPVGDLAALRRKLAAAARTSSRIGRVLEFYADRLSEPDRYLLAAVSLFARPIEPAAVLAVAGHEAFGSRLAGWTPAMVQAAVRDRLAGLASWHPDGTISAHPLVRDTFRPLVMDAAEVAAETALADVPEVAVTSRADALRVVEAIELLLDAGQWQHAEDLLASRLEGGYVFMYLSAPRFGQHAESAFVATVSRRDACASHLGRRRMAYYVAGVGFYATASGDMVMANEFLNMAIEYAQDAGDTLNVCTASLHLAECLGTLGEIEGARSAAAESLSCGDITHDRFQISQSHAYLGWLAGLVGDTAEAEQQFIAADQIHVAIGSNINHLTGGSGIRWAEWLGRTRRFAPAQKLTERNRKICLEGGYEQLAAQCDRLLGRLALNAEDYAAARDLIAKAAEHFRNGDYLTELAITLIDLAECARAVAEFDTAEHYVAEAIAIASPRGLIPAQSAALAARARIRADLAVGHGTDYLAQGRDAADAALRLASRHHLTWHELDAFHAHARLDQAEGTDLGWAARMDTLHTELVPPGLDSDPLATIEQRAALGKSEQQETPARDPHAHHHGSYD